MNEGRGATWAVLIGMDPHKRSATIEVIDERERVLALVADDVTVALRMLVDRRDEPGCARTEVLFTPVPCPSAFDCVDSLIWQRGANVRLRTPPIQGSGRLTTFRRAGRRLDRCIALGVQQHDGEHHHPQQVSRNVDALERSLPRCALVRSEGVSLH